MIDEDEPLAILGSTSSLKTMADGSLRISIDVSPKESKPAFQLFGTPGTAVAIAVIKNEVALEHDRPKSEGLKTEYGEYARALKLSDFFRSPPVWKAVGTDAEYLEWVRGQPSAVDGAIDHGLDGNGNTITRNVAAHVRHVEHGSGTGFKPPYSAIPLCQYQHDKAHQKGDSELGDRDWWAKMRIKYVSDWCWERLKAQLGFESWADTPPIELVDWARDHDLLKYLPSIHRGWMTNAESETSSEDGQQPG